MDRIVSLDARSEMVRRWSITTLTALLVSAVFMIAPEVALAADWSTLGDFANGVLEGAQYIALCGLSLGVILLIFGGERGLPIMMYSGLGGALAKAAESLSQVFA